VQTAGAGDQATLRAEDDGDQLKIILDAGRLRRRARNHFTWLAAWVAWLVTRHAHVRLRVAQPGALCSMSSW